MKKSFIAQIIGEDEKLVSCAPETINRITECLHLFPNYQISEISDVSVVGKRISNLLPLKPSGRIFLLLVVFCKVILYLLLLFLVMSVLLIVIVLY